MSKETKAYKRIRAEDAQDFVNWSLPVVGEAVESGLKHKNAPEVTVVEEVIAAEKITVAELESIREAARIEGLAAGLEEGRLKGEEKGRAEGLTSGRDIGFKEGFQKGEAETLRLQKLLSDMMAELQNPIKESVQEVEEQLVQLVTSLASAVVETELETRKDLLAASIHQALEQLPDPISNIQLMVNDADVEFLQQANFPSDVVIESEPNLTAGGFRLKTENTLIQHEVESRFSSVVEQFHNNVSHHTSDDNE